eukprot:g42557.t1
MTDIRLTGEIPTCIKKTTISPVPKKDQAMCLNGYRLVALNYIVMKSVESQQGQATTPSSTIILNAGALRGCVLSPLLYSLYTHDYVTKFSSNSIDKFADDTTLMGRISNNDEAEYRKEIDSLRVVIAAQSIVKTSLHSIDSVYTSRYLGKAANIIKDPSHPGYTLFHPLPSGRRYKSLKT